MRPEKGRKPRNTSVETVRVLAPRTTQRIKSKIPFLAAELGQPVDDKGEPIGAGSAMVKSDAELQDYTLQLWRQMQSGRAVNKHLRAVERAGLNIDDVWMVGINQTLTTSSTPDEARRYRQKLLFRANLLEAILSETISKLFRLDRETVVVDGERAGPKGPEDHGPHPGT